MLGAFFRRLGRNEGIALIIVVMVLSSMLILGTAFMHNIRLDYAAAVNYARTGQAECFALEGLHRAQAELMYDVWGVNEKRAFICAPEWGQLSNGYMIDGVNVKAAYALDGDPTKQIVAHSAVWRRTLENTGIRWTSTAPPGGVLPGNTWVQTDYRWMYKDRYGAIGVPDPDVSDIGVHYGGVYLDEFLPEHTDPGDVYELGLHFNHGKVMGRSFANDAVEGERGMWSGKFWPWMGGGETSPWDYVDTRQTPDSFFHIFRYDLVGKKAGTTDYRVYCTGVKNQDPLQPIPKEDPNGNFAFTHLGTAADAVNWPLGDTWGEALNINEVNNNYRWEIYHNYRDYDGIGMFKPHHYKEAKWIYVYNPAGTRKLGRYAVTVDPDSGKVSANRMFDGPTNRLTKWNEWDEYGEHSADYLRAIDKGFLPHGDSNYTAPPNGVNLTADKPYDDIIKAYQNKYTYANAMDGINLSNWASNTTTRINKHISDYGMLTSRSELALLLRKDAFKDELTDAELARDARIMSALTSTAGYEYLLDPHWERDRIIIDAGWAGKPYTNGALYANAGTRQRLADYLQSLKFYWGPDQRLQHDPFAGGWNWLSEKNYHFTPFHSPLLGDPLEQQFSKADMEAKGQYPVIPAALAGFGVSDTTLNERARRAKLSVLSWLMGSTDFNHGFYMIRDAGSHGNIHARWDPNQGQYVYHRDNADIGTYRAQFANGNMVVQMPKSHKIVQVGRVTPKHPTQEENGNYKDNDFPCDGGAGGRVGAPGFDQPEMSGTYRYVMLQQRTQCSSRDTHVPLDSWENGWTPVRLYVGGQEILYQDGRPADAVKRGVFALYVSPDMNMNGIVGEYEPPPRDECATSDQTLHSDVWSWKGAEGGLHKVHPCWLNAWEKDASAGPIANANQGDDYIEARNQWGKVLPGGYKGDIAATHMYVVRGKTIQAGARTSAMRDISSKKSHVGDHFGGYITIFWKESLGYDGDEIALVQRSPATSRLNVVDYVKLPGSISSLNVGEAYAAIDAFNRSAPQAWQKVPSTYPFRNAYKKWDDDAEGWDDWASANCGQHWAGGLNLNNCYNMWPEYRRDYQNGVRANGWHAAGHAAMSFLWILGNSTLIAWSDLRRCKMPFMPPLAGTLDDLKAAPNLFASFDRPVKFLKADDNYNNSDTEAASFGYYAPYNPYHPLIPPKERAYWLHYVYDPDLRIWADLAQVAPIDQYFITGVLTDLDHFIKDNYTSMPALGMSNSYPDFDYLDNDNDGVTDMHDTLSQEEMLGPQVPGGHYIVDRRSMSRMNLNNANHPAAVWALGLGIYGQGKYQLAIIGRRPLYGYTTLIEAMYRSTYQWADATDQYKLLTSVTASPVPTSQFVPYNKLYWWKNAFASPVLTRYPSNMTIEHQHMSVQWFARVSSVAPSPVYTVYVTAQTVVEDETDPRRVYPNSEIRVRATVERTWDGKMNLLEFTWIPQDVQVYETE